MTWLYNCYLCSVLSWHLDAKLGRIKELQKTCIHKLKLKAIETGLGWYGPLRPADYDKRGLVAADQHF